MEEREFVLKFSLFDGFGYKKIELARNYFGNLATAFANNSLADWRDTGINSKLVIGWLEFKKNFKFHHYQEKLNLLKINYIEYWDSDYPEKLRNIYSPPAVLYWQGNLNLLAKDGIAVVGTRNFSDYGRRATESLVYGLVENGLVVISGLALGIDVIAHRAALEAQGETIAVMGGSLEKISPVANMETGKKILENSGLILSETPIDGIVGKWNFPARNRIVSALSQGVLVTEAPAKSGALITANFALEQGKSVFAVPGSIFSARSRGCHNLIRDGAVTTSEIGDILQELGYKERENAGKIKLEFDNDLQIEIMKCLEGKAKIIDEIVLNLNQGAPEIIAEINMMYLKGWIGEESGGRWYRKV